MTVTLPVSGIAVTIDFDPREVDLRNTIERQKRINPRGAGQFQQIDEILDYTDTDFYTAKIDRPAVREDHEVLVLGGGFGGILAGVHLRDYGFHDIRIVEQAGDFGGTWYWNRYPGVQCDIESYVYLPLLEETDYVPNQRFSDGSEILEHAKRIARHYDLYHSAMFHTTVTSATWLSEERRWEVHTDRGDVLRCRFLIRANGPLSKPQLPRIPGIRSFDGTMFHTSRWNYEYTGGGSHGNLHKLRDKRVAIVGTGASAVQAVPYLAADAMELMVVQRTPSSLGVRGNRPTDPDWVRTLQPGWQRERIDNFNRSVNFAPPPVDLVADGWTELFRVLGGQSLVDVPVQDLPEEDQVFLRHVADLQAMRPIHARIDRIVNDAATAEALKPWFGMACKRPCFNDGYLPAFNEPNVTLVSAPAGVESISPGGFVAGGKSYDVEIIIFATGFETGTSSHERYGYDLAGRNGCRLSDYFASGLRTLHGFYTHHFPNFFELGLSQTAYGANFTYMLDQKARHVARLLSFARRSGFRQIEASEAAQQAWVRTIYESNEQRRAYWTQCTPGVFNGQGDVSRAYWGETYGGGELEFWTMMESWWEAGTFAGLELST